LRLRSGARAVEVVRYNEIEVACAGFETARIINGRRLDLISGRLLAAEEILRVVKAIGLKLDMQPSGCITWLCWMQS